VIAYRLGPEGIRERTVLAQGISELLWPRDGQYAVHDLDADGQPEIWFTNAEGGLWRIDPSPAPAVKRIAQVKGGFGPIAGAPSTAQTPTALFIAMGRTVLRLTAISPSSPSVSVPPRLRASSR
jgi:hypothetical protein